MDCQCSCQTKKETQNRIHGLNGRIVNRLLKMKKQPGTAAWARACYGIDTSTEQPTIVRATRVRGAVSFEKIDSVDERMRAELLSGKSVLAACLSTRESLTRQITAPFSDRHKAEKVFPSLLDILLPFPLEACTYEFLDIRHGHGEQQSITTMAVATRLENITSKLAALAELELDPPLLDQEGLALWTQSLREKPITATDEIQPVRVVISLGREHTSLVIGTGQDFVSAHGTGQSSAETIVRLLKTALPANTSTVQWAWCGAGANDSGRLADLQSQLTAKWPSENFIHDDPACFLARALATRALWPGPLRSNLRTGPALHPRIRLQQIRRSMALSFMVLLGGLLLCAANITWRNGYTSRTDRLKTAFTSLGSELCNRKLTGLSDEGLKQVRESLDLQIERLSPFMEAFEPSRAALMAKVIREIRLQECHCELLRIAENGLDLTCTTSEPERYNLLVEKLETIGFNDVRVFPEAPKNGVTRFRLTAGGLND